MPALRALLAGAAIFCTLGAKAQTPVARAGAWLAANRNAGGSWGTVGELAERDTARVLLALQVARGDSQTAPGSLDRPMSEGYAWLASRPLDANQLLAEQALALTAANLDASAILAKLTQQRSGTSADFGGFADHNGDAYDSALALQAFAANETLYGTFINGIVTSIVVHQNADGGWGIDGGFASNPLLTAEVLLGLGSLHRQLAPAAVIAAAQAYLGRNTGIDGSVAGDVLTTAVAFRALALTGNAQHAYVTLLNARQEAAGSWGGGNAYVTARVVEALGADRMNLVIAAGGFTLTPAAVADGNTVTADVTVTNAGTQTANQFTISLYASDARSAPIASVGSGRNTEIGESRTFTIPFLPAGLSGSRTLVAVASTTPKVAEIRDDDNEATATLTVTGKPDLQLFAADITTTPARPQPGQPATLLVTIRNGGEGDVPAAGYAIYDAHGGTGESLLQSGTTGAVAAGGSQTISLPVTLTGGSHTIRAVADPGNSVAEVSETNNEVRKDVAVSNVANVDLKLRSVTVAPPRPNAGDVVTITAVVENSGTAPVTGTIALYDGVPGGGSVVINSQTGAIDPQSTAVVVSTYTVKPTSRVIYAVADPDNLVSEIDETNNSAFATLTDQLTDLEIVRDGIVLPKPMPAAGQSASASVVVRNKGLVAATHVQVDFYDDLPQRGGIQAAAVFVDVPAQGSAVVPVTWNVRAGQHLATAVVNAGRGIFEPDYVNNRATNSYTANGSGQDVFFCTACGAVADVSQLTVDPLTLNVSGRVTLPFIDGRVATPYVVSIFEDVDGDLAFNPEVDNALGSTLVQPYGGGPIPVIVAVQGTVRFAPGHLVAYLDSGNAVAEVDESNNVADLYHQCSTDAGRSVTPRAAKWTTTNPSNGMSTVGRILDTNGDGVIDANDVPMVVIASVGGIIVRRGDNGAVVWAKQFDTSGKQITPVIADLDGDGKPEILAHTNSDPVTGETNQHRLVALNAADGSRKWTSPQLARAGTWESRIALGQTYLYAGAPAVADLDGDGHPELICGRTVLHGADGSIAWTGTGGAGRAWIEPGELGGEDLYAENFPDQEAPIAVDVDGDGRLDVVAGNTVYRADGTILWQRSDLPDGYTAPVYLGGETRPHVCLVAQGRVWLLASDGTTTWGPINIPNGALLGGAPTVFTAAGTQRIAVAGDGYLSAFNAANGAVLWTRQVSTDTSFLNKATNAATFFNAFGAASLFYVSRTSFSILDGASGAIQYSAPFGAESYYPGGPAIADIDDDGHAEAVVPGMDAVRIVGDPTWFGAPAIFNQWGFRSTNVANDHGSIPAHEVPDAFARQNFRGQQSLVTSTVINNPNLTVSYPRADGSEYPAKTKLIVRVGNNGWTAAPPAVVTFKRGTSDADAVVLGTANTSAIAAGGYEDVVFTVTNPPAAFSFFAVVAAPSGVAECDASDNRSPIFSVRLSADVAAVASSLVVSDLQPRPGDAVDLAATAMVSGAVNTGVLAAQFFLGNPAAGGMAISPLLPVTLTSNNGVIAQVSYRWTAAGSAGPVSIYVVFDPQNAIPEDDETNNKASMAIVLSTAETVKKLSATITLTPPAAEPGTPVRADLLVQNIGNVALNDTVVSYSVSGGAGSGSVTLAALAKNNVASLTLGTFIPAAAGTYFVTAAAADPDVTLLVSPKSVTVGSFAAGLLSVVPSRVPITLPLVQVHAHVTRANTVAVADDPLLPLVKMHVQQAVDFQTAKFLDSNVSTCFKCHVHVPGIAAIEAARRLDGVHVNDAAEQGALDRMLALRTGDGLLPGQAAYTTDGTTRTAAWALAQFHDATTVAAALPAMTQQVLHAQTAGGFWQCNGGCQSGVSFSGNEAQTLMAIDVLARTYDQTADPAVLDALTRGARWLIAYDLTPHNANDCELVARVGIALAHAKPYLDPGTAALAQDRLGAIARFLRSLQNADGSFGLQTLGRPYTRNAQALEVLVLAGASPSDPAVRNATLWFLNHHAGNGAWSASLDEHGVDETAWSVIALAAAWSKLTPLRADLHLNLPAATDALTSLPAAGASNASGDGRELVWHLGNVTDSGYDVYANLRLNGLQTGETRAVASAASITYTDPYSGQPVTRTLAVPTVTGTAPVGLAVATDRASYSANQTVTVTESITDATAGITNDVVVRDSAGATIATLATGEALTGLPPASFAGWHCALPVTVPSLPSGSGRVLPLTIDFAQQLAALGAAGAFDVNSIRVSLDSAPSSELVYGWSPTASGAAAGLLTIGLPDALPAGSALAFHIFFDTADNGFKPASLFTRARIGGAGFTGSYYRLDLNRVSPFDFPVNESQVYYLTPAVVTRFEPTTDLGDNFPFAEGLPHDYFVSVWNGAFNAPAAGSYTFDLSSDEGSWLFIDGVQVINYGGSHAAGHKTGAVTLTAGFHSFRVTHLEWNGEEYLSLRWAPPGSGLVPIPAENLFPFVPTAPAGLVVGAPEHVTTGSTTRTLQWNTAATPAGTYSVNATLRDGGTLLAAANAPFTITPGSQLTASVSTDRAAYDPTQTAHVTASVQYATGNVPLTNLTAIASVTDATGAVLATRSTPIASLQPGQIATAAVDWTVGGAAAGTYTASVVVKDASGATLATRSVPFIVRSTTNITATLTALPLTATITNNGNAPLVGAPFVVQIGSDIINFNADVAIGATVTKLLTAPTAPGTYTATLLYNGQPLATTTFTIVPTVVTATVATDKPAYDLGDIAHVTTAVTLASAPAPLTNVDVVTTVNGVSTTTTIPSIAPGGSANVTVDVPIGTTVPGTYTVTVTVRDVTATTTFTVVSSAVSGKGITGSLTALPLTVSITNNGNAPLVNAPFVVQIGSDIINFNADVAIGATTTKALAAPTAPGTYTATLLYNGQPLAATTFTIIPTVVTATVTTDKPAYDLGDTAHVTTAITLTSAPAALANVDVVTTVNGVSTTSTIPSLAPGGSANVTVDVPIGTTSPGTYTVTVAVRDVTATTTCTVVSSAVSGKGITGALTTLPLMATITNNGNAPLLNAPFVVQIGNDSITFNADVAIGARATQLLTAPTAPGTYTATLSFNGRVLATTAFTVEPSQSQPTLAIGPTSSARVVIWTSCPNCTPVAPFLTATLTSAGIPWTLVGDETAFLTALRSGGYSAAILAPPQTSEPQLAAELSEAIHGGLGLLVLDDHGDAMPKLAAALGLAFRGKLNTTSTLLDLLPTPVTAAGALTVNGDGIRLDLGTAFTVARIAATQSPAIGSNLFGSGRVVVVPFDVEKTATPPMAKLLIDAVRYVSRPPAHDARSIVPVDIAITAPAGGNLAVTVSLDLGAGLAVIDALPQLTTQSPPMWSINVPGGSTSHVIVWLRLPNVIASSDVKVTLTMAGQPVAVKTLTLAVPADRAALETALTNDLAALASAVPAKSLKFVTDAQNELAALRALPASTATSTAAAVQHLLNLVSDLDALPLDTTRARADADRLLAFWQSGLPQ
jgi:subtilase family serine protease